MTIDVAIPIEEAAAKRLQADPLKRAALGRLISQWFDPANQIDRLIEAMNQMSDHAQAAGLTEAILAEELAAHKRERQG